MGLRDIGATLPPGFRFYPSDEELVCHYLYKKITNEEVLKGTLVEIDLHTCEPWQLPEVAKLNATEWYFFSFRDRKYATGYRTNRATTSGYWKATGKDRTVLDPVTREIIGMRKTLVFYRNRAPNGIKTGWIMHEFRLETPHMPPKEDWVLCRVFHKSKGDESTKLMLDTTSSCAPNSLNLAPISPPTDHNIQTHMPCGYNQVTSFSSSTPPHQTTYNRSTNSLLNLLQFSHEKDCNNAINQVAEINSRNDHDEYDGFLWDMTFQENHLENHEVASDLDEMRFEMDDNSMVFL